MSVKWRVYAAYALIALCMVGWPATQFWLAPEEPPIVLALSWGALLLTAVDIAFTADVREQQEDDE